MEKKYVIITNPGHEYASLLIEHLINEKYKIIALFTLKWRYKRYKKKYSFLSKSFYKEIHAFNKTEEEVVSYLDQQLLEEANSIATIIPWDDSSGTLGGLISDKFKLNWNSVIITKRFREKSLMREHLATSSSIPVVEYVVTNQLADCYSFQKRIGRWPIVLKPVSAGSSCNVFFANSDKEIEEAFNSILGSENIFDNIINESVQVEEYLDGIEYAVNGLTDKHGNIFITDVFRYKHSPIKNFKLFISEAEYLQPELKLVNDLSLATQEIINYSELKNCPFHAELKMTNTGPRLIEIQARFPGHLASLSRTAIYPELMETATQGYLKKLEFDRPFDIFKPTKKIYAVAVSGDSQQSGILREITDLKAIKKIPSFIRFSYLPEIGDEINITKDEDDLLYVALLSNNDHDLLTKDIMTMKSLVHFNLQ